MKSVQHVNCSNYHCFPKLSVGIMQIMITWIGMQYQ